MSSKPYIEIAPGVWSIKIVFVNIYMITTGLEEWVLVDTGFRGSAAKITAAAEELFGDMPPSAIILTHGHFDHAGNVKDLLKKWPVEIYAHPLELPYLTGLSDYPPADPTAGGGFLSFISFTYANSAYDLEPYIHPLPKDGTVPYMPDWSYIHTPGHTPGHISLFRASDRVLIAGDAFVNTQSESLLATLTQKKKLSGPPKYFTPNWLTAAISVKKLKDLRPEIAGTGHGPVIQGDELVQGLGNLADNFQQLAMPSHGRYIREPAKANRKGVQYLPPEPLNKGLIFSLFALSAIAAFCLVRDMRK